MAASDDLLRVCYTHEVGMQNLDPKRLPFACANCGEDSAIVARLKALLAERDALRARAERAEAALRVVGVPLINNVMCWCHESRDMAYGHSDACRQAKAALAGSREQAAGEGANPTSDSGESSRLSE